MNSYLINITKFLIKIRTNLNWHCQSFYQITDSLIPCWHNSCHYV